jgi:hypothetical protein
MKFSKLLLDQGSQPIHIHHLLEIFYCYFLFTQTFQKSRKYQVRIPTKGNRRTSDKKMWLNKDGLQFGANARISLIRQFFVDLQAHNRIYTDLMINAKVTRFIASQGGSQGSSLIIMQGIASNPQRLPPM